MDFRVVLFGIGATTIGYFIWRGGSRASSLIRGTATANIATAAKGFTEVKGKACASPSGPLRDPITDQPCVWFAIETEKFSILDKFQWKRVKTAQSSRPFVIDDGTGRCLVSPSDVEIDKRTQDTIIKDSWNLRHKVWWIREGDPVYAIGYLRRTSDTSPGAGGSGASGVSPDEEALTKRATEILRTWKRDPKQHIAKFDSDGNGRIDEQEWEAVRVAARAQAAAETRPRETASNGDVSHVLVKPPDGRPFLLTTHGEASLVSRNRSQSFWGLVFFVVGVITLVSLLRGCLEGAS